MMVPALSVKQPWASLMAQGGHGAGKDIETRVWATKYRGPLVICSTKEPRDQGPVGQALCVRMLKDCRWMTREDETAARCKLYERAIAWCFGRCWSLYPQPVQGQRGLFTVVIPETAFPDPRDLAEVKEALAWAEEHDKLKYVTRKS